MKRILLVDDEPAVLRGLERIFRARRHEWECAFVGSPTEAIELIDTWRPEVVVSDMRMPGMTGVELLRHVQARQPASTRIILSGEVGAAALADMIGVAHQCLGKPCNTELLLGRLARALSLQEAVPHPQLREQLYRVCALPILPEHHAALIESMRHTDAVVRESEMLKVLYQAPGLALKILQVANWRRSGSGLSVSILRDAVRLLGNETVHLLAHSALLQPVPATAVTPTWRRLWSECQAASALAHAIAESEHHPPALVARASLVALLAGIGAILLEVSCPADAASVRAEAEALRQDLATVERRCFGVSSVEAAACLCQLWGLEDSLVEAVSEIGRPGGPRAASLDPNAVAHVALEFTRHQPGGCPGRANEFLTGITMAHRVPAFMELASRLNFGGRQPI